jgi:hypothetical protein
MSEADRRNGPEGTEISLASLQEQFQAAGRALLEQYEHPAIENSIAAFSALRLTEHEIVDLVQEAGQKAALKIFERHLARPTKRAG